MLVELRRQPPASELDVLRRRVQELEAQVASLRGESQRVRTPDIHAKISSDRITQISQMDAAPLLEMVQTLAGVASWRWDRSTGRSECSPAILELFGVPPGSEFRLEDIFARFHPEDRAKIRFDGRSQSLSKVMEPNEYRIIREDGSIRYILSTVAPLHSGESDEQSVWVGLLMDVTERYHLEQELKNAQKMEALGRLAGGVAHDFNNYLTVALGNAELLRAGNSKESEKVLLDEIIRASERCQVLTNRLLEFGRKKLVRAPVINALDVVLQSQAMLRRLLPDSIDLRYELPERAVRVRVDAAKLEQVILNLVLNARDSMKGQGEILVRVHSEGEPPQLQGREDSPGNWACLSVKDAGQGMDSETRSRVFEPFFTTKPVGRGTGLGLSIVYGIVAQAGGWMDVQSEPGEGSVFDMWLPLADES